MASSTEWRIIWQDDFMGAAGSPPSPERWKIVTGRPWAGGIETDSSDPVHLSLNGEGQLRLTATHDGDDRYTAAWIETSRDDFLPPAGGALRIEARVKTAAGLGLDCALWAWGSVQRHSEEKDPVQRWYRAGETDIFEVLGSDPAGVYGVIHSPTCKGHPTLQLPSLGMGTRASTPDNEPLSADYHTYSIVWRRDPDSITWYLDGRQYLHLTPADTKPEGWLFNQPVFLCMAIIVGSPGGPILPGALDPKAFPTTMLVDSITVSESTSVDHASQE